MKYMVLNLALLVFGSVAALAQLPTSNSPAVAYQSGGSLFIATSSGRILKTLKTVPAIGTFAISRDAQQIVFAPLGKKPDSYGGQLYLLVPPKTVATRLTHGPYYNKSARSSEVYSNPDFSPDGKQVVFSIHSQSTGDVVEAAGPFATIDLRSGKIALLDVTLHVPGEAWGTAYADSAYWSPDGSHILLNFEDSFALTDQSGQLFENLSSLTTGDDWTSSVGWLGSQCVVYVGGKDYPDSQKRPAKVLNLKTQKTALLNGVLGLSEQQTTDLVAISGSMRVRRQDGKLAVETRNGQWSIPDTDHKSSVRLLPSTSEAGIPEECR
jgi:hypothetical protein